MTDNNSKPIIIDGVDVSGCEHYGYRGSAGYWCHDYDEPCTDYPNCCFKQLARKTQECEELKERLNSRCFDPKNNNNRCISYNRIAEDYERDLKQLYQLKAENETYKKMFEDEDIQLALTEIISGERHLWYNKTDKLSKTLAEIRDIATCCIDCDVARIRMKQILQKISECAGNNE